MRVSTVSEFRDRTTVLLKSKEPVLITRRGRLAGIFFPSPEGTVSLGFHHQLFNQLSAEIGRRLRKNGSGEEEIQSDFEAWRKTRREAPLSAIRAK